MLDDYRSHGRLLALGDDEVFVVDTPARDGDGGPPVLVIHGFPTSSIDWIGVLPEMSARRRVILFDLPGFGFSSKPDRPYSIFSSADATVRLVEALELGSFDLVTHDMGDTVGGELLARDLEGELPSTSSSPSSPPASRSCGPRRTSCSTRSWPPTPTPWPWRSPPPSPPRAPTAAAPTPITSWPRRRPSWRPTAAACSRG
jgi:pimeloyl-ACP methyl ester carboxylesterase